MSDGARADVAGTGGDAQSVRVYPLGPAADLSSTASPVLYGVELAGVVAVVVDYLEAAGVPVEDVGHHHDTATAQAAALVTTLAARTPRCDALGPVVLDPPASPDTR